jgi:copper resistance protein B
LSFILKETLNKPFDKLKTNGEKLIPFVVSLSNHEWNQLIQKLLNPKALHKMVFVFLALIFTTAWAEETDSSNMEMMTGYDQQGMDHSKMMHHNAISTEKPPPEGRLNGCQEVGQRRSGCREGWVGNQSNKKLLKNPYPNHNSDKERVVILDSTALKANRDPNAYTNGNDYSGLSKPMMGDSHKLGSFIVDRLEGVSARDELSMTYDWQAWYGQDYDKLVIRAEGEIDQGTFKNNRNEALWGHALTAFWDTQLGVRIDSGMGTDRVWGAFGVQGFAPYWIYVEATAYVGEEGRTAFRLETEYDVLFTQKLILQPRIEMNFYSDNDRSRLVGSGLSNIEAGLRLRYEIEREFGPYIGIEWASTFGSAADVIRSQGNRPEETRFMAGVHFWF